MTAVRVKLGTNGRLVIPANLRREAGLGEGKTVLIETSADGLRIRPMEDVVMQAQKKLQKYIKRDVSLTDELIEDRRAEAIREN